MAFSLTAPAPCTAGRRKNESVCWSRCAVKGPLFQQVKVLSR